MPLHQGHLSLIEFAAAHCQQLFILLGVNKQEPIPGHLRLQWLKEAVAHLPQVQIVLAETNLPATSVASREVSRQWANYIGEVMPPVDLVFSSEAYGPYVAEYLQARHVGFDQARERVPVSATQIREHPMQYWEYIAPPVRPYFVQKFCLYGPESTGKSILAEKLAAHFDTCFVPEVGRELIPRTSTCTYADLQKVAVAHAELIKEKLKQANKILFLDTDVFTTQAYAEMLFNRALPVDDEILHINRCRHYFFLDTDVEYWQDGTRLGKESWPLQREVFLRKLENEQVSYSVIKGGWQERFERMVRIAEQYINR